MGKNIVICSDGTGSSANKNRGTNVFKIYEAVDLNHKKEQVSFYDDGVGTERFKILKVMGGAFGFGLSRNVRQLYADLARIYEPGDNIYLFGFSRGAFTVRTLAGFISKCGVLNAKAFCENDSELINKVEGAYKAYRRSYSTPVADLWRETFKSFTKRKYGFVEASEFKKYTHNEEVTPIHFLGVWDTVSAVGFPVMWVSDAMNTIYRFKFPDHKLGANVRNAYQALSIDDKRKTFHPEMWDEASDENGAPSNIQQVWFAGVHSNVGGGYSKQGMSLVSLDWMMEKAQKAGLSFISSVKNSVHDHANVNDKLYDSRSGVAVYYRYDPRNIGYICDINNIYPPLIHDSVLQRSLNVTGGYAPGNLPNYFKFVSSQSDGYVKEEEASQIQMEMEKTGPLLGQVSFWVKTRQWLHTVFFVLTGIFAYLMIKEYSFSSLLGMIGDPDSSTLLKSGIAVLFDSIWLLVPTLLVVGMSVIARKRIQNTFSSFWYFLSRKHFSIKGEMSKGPRKVSNI